MKRMTQGASVACLIAVAALGGCRRDRAADDTRAEHFLRDDETSAVTRIADAQSAAGARTDATLRAYHFDQDGIVSHQLNSLGREKLDLMLAGETGETGEEFVVFLDLNDDPADRRLRDSRVQVVTLYLHSKGLTDDVIRVEDGANPDNTMLVTSARPEKAPDGGGGGIFEMLGAMFEGMSGGGNSK